LGAVQISGPSCLIGEKFPIEGGLEKVLADDRHRASIDLKKVETTIPVAVLVAHVQCEDPIRNDPELQTSIHLHAPLEWVLSPNIGWEREIGAGDQTNTARLTAAKFERHHDIGKQKGVLKKDPANRAILLTPRERPYGDAVFFLQNGSSFVAQAVNHTAGAALVIVVELGARPFQKAMVVEQFQSPQKLLGTATHESDNMGRTQKAVPVNKPDDFAVALRKAKGGNQGGAFESRKPGRFHPPTISECDEAEKPSKFAPDGKFAGGSVGSI